MKHLVMLIVLASVLSARAEPIQLGVHLFSFHQRAGFKTTTPGLYLEWSGGLVAGVLRNSEGRIGVYAARNWETGDRRWSLTVGGITGYRSAVVTPLIVPSVRLPVNDGLALRVALIPKPPGSGGCAALHLALERSW